MVLINTIRIGLFFLQSLILFFILNACVRSDDKPASISIRWEKDQASGILIPRSLLAQIPEDSIINQLHVHLLQSKVKPAMLGEWTISEEYVLFEPLISLTHGLSYEVRWQDKLLGQIQVPMANSKETPAIVAIYPTQDTLPHNLLKMYIRFSKPMQEGNALKHIVVIKNNQDTAKGVFLDLQPELWNHDRTMLTLWLDPGRIKRDLQPNKQMGEPLQPGAHYQVYILPDWQAGNGSVLSKHYHKDFVVTQRDNLSPQPAHWTLQVPKAGTAQSLRVNLHESLDYVLLKNAVRIVDAKGDTVPGVIEIGEKESILRFTPSSVWKSGEYILESEARLEDLAGNNLNRIFDRDINLVKSDESKEVFKRVFSIK